MKPNNTRQQMTENIGLWGASLWSDCKLQINVFLYYCYLNKNIKWVISEFPYAIYFNTSICTKPFVWKWLTCMKMNLQGKTFPWKRFCTKTHFDRGKRQLGNGLLFLFQWTFTDHATKREESFVCGRFDWIWGEILHHDHTKLPS